MGDNLENYQLRDLKEEFERVIPGVRVRMAEEATDPRTYRVSFDRIERLWGFRTSRRVTDGIQEIANAIRAGAIPDPDHPRYVNA